MIELAVLGFGELQMSIARASSLGKDKKYFKFEQKYFQKRLETFSTVNAKEGCRHFSGG